MGIANNLGVAGTEGLDCGVWPDTAGKSHSPSTGLEPSELKSLWRKMHFTYPKSYFPTTLY